MMNVEQILRTIKSEFKPLVPVNKPAIFEKGRMSKTSRGDTKKGADGSERNAHCLPELVHAGWLITRVAGGGCLEQPLIVVGGFVSRGVIIIVHGRFSACSMYY